MAKPATARASKPQMEYLEVDHLRLDPDNPRLPEGPKRSPDELVLLLAQDFSLTELGRSIAINGYFTEEPLAAVRVKTNEYLVVEGNRRLAALKLLTDPGLRRRLKLTEWDEIAALVQGQLGRVPVVVYDRRDDLLTFMGFRHITGVKQWDPLAKARFIHMLIDKYEMDFRKAAQTVGSKANAVRQQFFAYRVYLQARDQFDLEVEGIERVYSTFYVAMRNPAIREFLGIDEASEDAANPKKVAFPVPKSKASALREFMVWLGGDKDANPILVDNSQIGDLGEVVSSPAALNYLRASKSLDAAKKLVPGEAGRLLENLEKASFYLDEALRDAHRHKNNRKVDLAIQRCTESLEQLRKATEQ